MDHKPSWDDRYTSGDLPWDTGRVEANLVSAINESGIIACKTFVLGCGTGTNAIWLSEQGFAVFAADISHVAIDKAREKAINVKADITFETRNILEDQPQGAPFQFVFDRGCFHCFDSADERLACAEKIAQLLNDDGLWLSMIGSTDGPPRESGPPRLSASEIMAAMEPYFEILSLKTTHFDSDMESPPRAWACLMRRRGQ